MNKKVIILGLVIILGGLTNLTATDPQETIEETKEGTTEFDPIKEVEECIAYEDYPSLASTLAEYKDLKLPDGSSLANHALAQAVKVFDAARSPEGIRIALEEGADPNTQLEAILTMKFDDHIELFILKLFAEHGAQLDKDTEKKLKAPEQTDKPTLIKAQQINRHITLLKQLKSRAAKKSSTTNEPKIPVGTSGKSQTISFLRVLFDDKESKLSEQELVNKVIIDYYSDKAPRSAYIPAEKIQEYEKVCITMIEEEKKMGSYYTFYHAHNYAINLIFDLNKLINEWLSINVGPSVTLRVPIIPEKTLDAYIDRTEHYFKEHPIPEERIRTEFTYKDLIGKWNVWDNYATYEDARKIKHSFAAEMLSISPALFANAGRDISETFSFFFESFSVLNLRKILNTFFDAWGFDKRYIPELMFIEYRYLKTLHGGGMIQIFIPKANVDTFVYLAHSKGTPYRDKLTDSYDQTKHRHTKISDFLEKYTQAPFSFNKVEFNKFEARIVFLPDFFLSKAGIIYKTYDFAQVNNKKVYLEAVNEIMQRMLMQWVSSGGFEKLSGDNANKPAIKLLQFIKAGEKFKEQKNQCDVLISALTALKSKLGELTQQLENI